MKRYGIGLLLAAGMWAQTPTVPYYVVFLRPHPHRTVLAKDEGERIQAAHMANIRRMAKEGVLVAAGPFGDTPTTISGVFVFKTDSIDAARRIAAEDPTVVEHRNTVEVHAWQGPPGIADEYKRLHALDPKTPENMQSHPMVFLYRGPSWEKRGNFLAEHARYLEGLRKEGKLGAAGGTEPADELVGFAVFKVLPLEEARKLMAEDPAVKVGVLRVEEHQWWLSEHVLPW